MLKPSSPEIIGAINTIRAAGPGGEIALAQKVPTAAGVGDRTAQEVIEYIRLDRLAGARHLLQQFVEGLRAKYAIV
jgi:hypothetical protein